MTAGLVGADGRARFPLRLLRPDGSSADIDAVFDSGYDGWLTLPPILAAEFGERLPPSTSLELADGTQRIVGTFRVIAALEGELLEIDVLELPGEPLAGVQLLAGCRVTMDLVPGGPVAIRRLP